MTLKKGRVTVPTDVDVIQDTLRVIDLWGADAIRDCDGTSMPEELNAFEGKQYATYYTTRKDNEWAKANPEEIQQMYLMSDFVTATCDGELRIDIMKHYYKPQLKVNTINDIKRWWEVIDRTTNEVIDVNNWDYDEASGEVVIKGVHKFHAYTVSFLAFVVWDPVHMFNALMNDWDDSEDARQMTFDVRQPKTQKYVLEKLRKWCEEHPEVDVIRFTTFFHQFTLQYDDQAREKFVDWFGYSGSVSPYILEQFEQEVGYKFRPEYIINQGYNNSTFVVPTKEYRDFMDFQMREVAKLVKVFVDVTHEYGKEAMMFLGDHWIGTEPFGEYFQDLGIDAVVGSVGDGRTLRLISDIKGVKYTEGRYLPYFFPDVFHEGGDPIKEAKVNWVTSRRALLRSPLDRIGYGGYLKLALQFPDFIDYITGICNQFRELYEHVQGAKPYCPFKVKVLNAWGKVRGWGAHLVHHGIWYKEVYSYSGILEALSGMPFDVEFISFDDVINNPACLDDAAVVINAGDAGTAFSGGEYWADPRLTCAIREYVYNGGGFIGVGEPSALQKDGHFFQLYDVLGVDREVGLSLHRDKYNWEAKPHFLNEGVANDFDFGEEIKAVYAFDEATVLNCVEKHKDYIGAVHKTVNFATNTYGKGRAVYMSGLPFSLDATRLLYKACYYAAGKEDEMNKWFSTNPYCEVNVYPNTSSYCVVNNTYEPQTTTVYTDKDSYEITLEATEIKWFDM